VGDSLKLQAITLQDAKGVRSSLELKSAVVPGSIITLPSQE